MENLHEFHYDPRSRQRLVFAIAATGALLGPALVNADLRIAAFALPACGLAAILVVKILWPMLQGARASSKITPTRLTYCFRANDHAPMESRSFLLAHIHSIRIDRPTSVLRLTDRLGDWHDLSLLAFPPASELSVWFKGTGIRLEHGPLPEKPLKIAA